MKKILFFTPFLVAVLALSCRPAAEKPASQTTEPPTQKSEKDQIVAKDTTMPVREYNFGQKTEFVMAMREQLADLNRKMGELAVKIEKSSEAVQSEAKPKFAALSEKAAQLKKQLDEISDATLSTWNVMKDETDKAFAALKDGLAQSNQVVSDKVAP